MVGYIQKTKQFSYMVHLAQREDRAHVVKIIEESFADNPSVVSVTNPRKPGSLRALARYAFDTAIVREGVWLSTDRKAVAICYFYGLKKEGLRDLWHQVLLVIYCIGLKNVASVMKREQYIKKYRPQDGSFLYFWFFGASEAGKQKRSAFELKQAIFDLSEKKKLPIYLETSVQKNRRVYERYGFEVYHEWQQTKDRTLFFMRRHAK